ncbi:major royal jelly protein [Colletotrichum sojae]|uniref:Major royal jelly protein n=1 Tax=Colletotrichum sojae TaxID=2175907 RepID=A0A8H6MX72_9PEZI|nr:major royal jelly protein [Colletotrichum sojae]
MPQPPERNYAAPYHALSTWPASALVLISSAVLRPLRDHAAKIRLDSVKAGGDDEKSKDKAGRATSEQVLDQRTRFRIFVYSAQSWSYLTVALAVTPATQGISISSTGRVFLSQRYSTTAPPLAVELLADNTTILYPDAAWNSYNSSDPSSDPTKTFVSIDGARIGSDGRYWLVD